MLKISKQVEYAISFLSALSRQEEETLLSLKAFSEENNISFLFLQKIVSRLKNNNLVKATQGPRGGYKLIVDLKKITLKKIVEIVDDTSGVVQCLRNGVSCPRSKTCTNKKTFQKINEDVSKLLSKISIFEFSK